MTDRYLEFLDGKAHSSLDHGFAPRFEPPALFDFQRHLVEWSCRKGRAAIFADCGLGKTLIQLTWAQNAVEATNQSVLILTPLAVARQTVREAEKFGIEAFRSNDGSGGAARVVVANYEKLHHFSPDEFSAVVCDESSILKNFDGARKSQITEFMKRVKYRLLCTATAAPNDYMELGTSSEALGEMGYMDMLNRFFRNDNNTSDTRKLVRRSIAMGGPKEAGWRFKGHAESSFWRWVCSWARACRRPSDLGFDDGRFVLPDLIEREHVVETKTLGDGMLFALPATNMREEREERRRTIRERCEFAAEMVSRHSDPAVVWCHLNGEGDLLEKIISGSVQVSGSHSDEEKEEAYSAFEGGSARVLIVKPKIGAWGLNWQHCAHVVTFASHSYEQYYQSVRRCWRFGQPRPVVVDLVATEGEKNSTANLRRKAEAADRMFSRLVENMNSSLRIRNSNDFTTEMEAPSWL